MESRGIAGGQTSREVGPRGASGGGNIDRARFGEGEEEEVAFRRVRSIFS